MLNKVSFLIGMCILMVFSSLATGVADAKKFRGDEYFHSPWLGISFYQDGEKVDMVSVDPLRKEYDRIKVKMEAKPFEIQIPIRTGNDRVRICVWRNDSIFSEVSLKSAIENSSVFSSMAALEAPVFSPPELFISNVKHNFYSGERLNSYSLFYNRIPVSMFSFPQDKSKRYHLSKQKGTLYMVVFMDLDMDGLFEREEVEYFILEF